VKLVPYSSVVDRHRFDADPDLDPNFHVDADPDPGPDWIGIGKRSSFSGSDSFARLQCFFYSQENFRKTQMFAMALCNTFSL
jgi:hypothetical protein